MSLLLCAFLFIVLSFTVEADSYKDCDLCEECDSSKDCDSCKDCNSSTDCYSSKDCDSCEDCDLCEECDSSKDCDSCKDCNSSTDCYSSKDCDSCEEYDPCTSYECDHNITKAFMNQEQTKKDPLRYLSNSTLWLAAASQTCHGCEDIPAAVRIYHTKICNQVSNVTDTAYDSSGNVLLERRAKETSTLGEQRLPYILDSDFIGHYVSPCSKRLLAVYNCPKAGSYKDAAFFIVADICYSHKDIKEELNECKLLIQNIIEEYIGFCDFRNPASIAK